MYKSSPEDDASPPETRNSPPSSQRTQPGSYGKACDICRKKKARCNFERPFCGYCRAFGQTCSYTAAAACATRRNAKKLSIQTKRERPAPQRKSSGGPTFKQPYSADPTSPSGYLTPVTPLDRRAHSATAPYHQTRSELLGSPIPMGGRGVYSPDTTSPNIPVSPVNGHGNQRYQPNEVPRLPVEVRPTPYGQATNGYLPDTVSRQTQRQDTYVAVPLMDHSEHTGGLMDGSGAESAHHAFAAQPTMHGTEDQSQRVVSPTTQQSLAHYQAQYTTNYDPYHRADLEVQTQHDPRQIPQDWNVRRQSIPLPASEQRVMYRYHTEVENQNGYIR